MLWVEFHRLVDQFATFFERALPRRPIEDEIHMINGRQ
jgi:hypothetical protein